MHKFVLNIFKAIITAVVLSIVATIVFSVYRYSVLDSKIQNVLVFMQHDVASNNCLTSDDNTKYRALFESVRLSMNTGDEYVTDITYNYGTESTYASAISDPDIHIERDLSMPAQYGDIMVLEVTANINVVGFASGSNNPVLRGFTTRQLRYVYEIPCQKYSK